jgi:transposase
MGQLLLPIFPVDTEFITPTLGVRNLEDTVYYLHSGVPIFSHEKNDHRLFRYITSKFILEGLCSQTEVCKVFHVSPDSVSRYKKQLETKGEVSFFSPEVRHGYAHKLTPDLIPVIQKKIDAGNSYNSIAKGHGFTEGTIRYAISTGVLKKRVIK